MCQRFSKMAALSTDTQRSVTTKYRFRSPSASNSLSLIVLVVIIVWAISAEKLCLITGVWWPLFLWFQTGDFHSLSPPFGVYLHWSATKERGSKTLPSLIISSPSSKPLSTKWSTAVVVVVDFNDDDEPQRWQLFKTWTMMMMCRKRLCVLRMALFAVNQVRFHRKVMLFVCVW